MGIVTLKSTKQEIYDALKIEKDKVEALKANKYDPVKEEQSKQKAAAVQSANESIEKNIFSDELNKKYTDLRTAITASEDRLKELYDIDATMADLTIVTNASNDLRISLQEEDARVRAESEKTNKELKETHDRTVQELKTDYSEKFNELSKSRKREIEEYEYNLTRTREKENDAWEDKKAVREAELAAKEEKAGKLLAEAEAKVAYIAELEAKVEAIPASIEEAKKVAYAEGEKAAGKEYGYKNHLAEKESEFRTKDFENQINRLTAELNKAYDSISVLQSKLDNAYSEIREIATKTVESTGGVKVIGSNLGDGRK